MLEFWYKEKRTLVDFRRGPLGPYFDGLADQFRIRGYSSSSVLPILAKCCQFNNFLIEQNIIRVADITPSLVDAFLEYSIADIRTTSRQYVPGSVTRCALKHLFDHLTSIGAWTPPKPKVVPKIYDWLFLPFLKSLRDEHEMAEVTIKRYREIISSFLDNLGEKVTRKGFYSLDAATVERYIGKHLNDSPVNYSVMASALRRFFRYCADQKFLRMDFSGLLPPSHRYRLASLPKGMQDSALDRMLQGIERETPGGARDYAIAILMMAYGIRGVSAAELLLDDIDWRTSRIRIRAQKGGKEVMLPLVDAVGDAIIAYLNHRHEGTPFREVFLTTRPPFRPLSSLAISTLIRRYMARAGVLEVGGGSRTLRYSWAIRALQHNSSIKAIADVLGHRYINTTFIYAKADLKALREVAMPWPEKG